MFESGLTLRKAARYLGYHPKTLQKLDRAGKLVPGRTATNRRLYTKEQLDLFAGVEKESPTRIVAYCRVSSQAQRPDLKNQRLVIEEFCMTTGRSNVDYIEEVGGGLNFRRKEFLTLVEDILSGRVMELIIAHKDRLARFGFELLEVLCARGGCRITIINVEKLSPEQEMVQDLMTIIHCFSSRLDGLRNYKKALKSALSK